MSFRALRVFEENGKVNPRVVRLETNDLTGGDIVIRVHYSSLNYKDALAITGKGKILKNSPLNPGIDAAGVIISSEDTRFKEGDQVLVTGCNIGEITDGGLSEMLRVSAANVVALPKGLTLKEAMILGTAGFTAALCLDRFLENHQRPMMGPILVTGATGGVGSFAIQILSHYGFEVWALSGKPESADFLKQLGASQVFTSEKLALGSKPLESIRLGGAVDNLGGEWVGKLAAHTQLWGNIACVGLAAGAQISMTNMALILRGVSLLGISSNNTPMPRRLAIWQHLASDWKPSKLNQILQREISLDEVISTADDFINRKVVGRIIVKLI